MFDFKKSLFAATVSVFLIHFAIDASAQANERGSEDLEARFTDTSDDINPQILIGQQNSLNAEGLFPVVDENGEVFYNKVVPDSLLTPVDIDLDVIETYEFIYDGKVYMNKVTGP